MKGTCKVFSSGAVISPYTNPNILSRLVYKDNIGSPTGMSYNIALGY